jgi:LPXTG-motif cell wall-anchored protein
MGKNIRLVTRYALALVMMLAAVIALSTTASAHSRLQSSTPSDGQVLTAEPSNVSGTYSEEADAVQSYMKVYYTGTNGSNIEVDNGDGKIDPNVRTNMNVTLKPGMGDGSYTVKWHTVTDDDGGIVDGSFGFTVKSNATASGPTSSVGTMQESGGDAASSTLPTTGSSDAASLLLAIALGIVALATGLTMRRRAARR